MNSPQRKPVSRRVLPKRETIGMSHSLVRSESVSLLATRHTQILEAFDATQ